MHAELAQLRDDLAPDLAAAAAVDRGDRRALRAPGAAPGLRRSVPRLGRASTSSASASERSGQGDVRGDRRLLRPRRRLGHARAPGMNFLVHNMCRLPGSGGTWMIVKGGMGTVTQQLARRGARGTAREIAHRRDGERDPRRRRRGDAAWCSTTARRCAPSVVVSNADPFRMRDAGRRRRRCPRTTTQRIDGYARATARRSR